MMRTMAAITEIPGPKGLPFLGSALDLRRDSLDAFLRARRDHGDVVRLSAGPPGLRTVLYCVFSAEGVQRVLASRAANYRKDNQFYEELRLSAGNGLVTAQDADYLRQRRLIQPLFTRRQVDTYARAVTLEADGTVERWRDVADGVVDVVREMDRLALRTVSRILFGADVEAAVDVIHDNFPVVSEYVTRRGYSPVNPPRSWPLPSNRRAEAATGAVYAVCDRIIAERRAADAADGSRLRPPRRRRRPALPPLPGEQRGGRQSRRRRARATRYWSSWWRATRRPRPPWPSRSISSPATRRPRSGPTRRRTGFPPGVRPRPPTSTNSRT